MTMALLDRKRSTDGLRAQLSGVLAAAGVLHLPLLVALEALPLSIPATLSYVGATILIGAGLLRGMKAAYPIAVALPTVLAVVVATREGQSAASATGATLLLASAGSLALLLGSPGEGRRTVAMAISALTLTSSPALYWKMASPMVPPDAATATRCEERARMLESAEVDQYRAALTKPSDSVRRFDIDYDQLPGTGVSGGAFLGSRVAEAQWGCLPAQRRMSAWMEATPGPRRTARGFSKVVADGLRACFCQEMDADLLVHIGMRSIWSERAAMQAP